MTNEPRIVEGYEITQSIHLGDKEIVFGIKPEAEMPYLCAYYTENEILGEYSECVVSNDYVEMIGIFATRIQEQGEKFKAERDEITVPLEVITANMCIPDNMDKSILGKVVAIRPSVLRPEYRTQDSQLVLCIGGNGAQPNARGSACFCINIYSGERCRWERRDILGEIITLPEWAKERVVEIKAKEQAERKSREER